VWEVEDGFGFFVLSGEEGFPAGAEACVPVPDAAQEALGVRKGGRFLARFCYLFDY